MTKVYEKCQKWSILTSFWKLEAWGQTVLPAKSLLKGQKLVENVKIKKKNQMRHFRWFSNIVDNLDDRKWDIFVIFNLMMKNHGESVTLQNCRMKLPSENLQDYVNCVL